MLCEKVKIDIQYSVPIIIVLYKKAKRQCFVSFHHYRCNDSWPYSHVQQLPIPKHMVLKGLTAGLKISNQSLFKVISCFKWQGKQWTMVRFTGELVSPVQNDSLLKLDIWSILTNCHFGRDDVEPFLKVIIFWLVEQMICYKKVKKLKLSPLNPF